METTAKGVFFSKEEITEGKPEYLILEAKNQDIFYKKVVELWKNNSYFTYTTPETKIMGTKFFIRINNDGSEDLVELGYNKEESWFTKIKEVTPKGEAKLWKEAIEKNCEWLNVHIVPGM